MMNICFKTFINIGVSCHKGTAMWQSMLKSTDYPTFVISSKIWEVWCNEDNKNYSDM